ncbi:sensor histidine kinase [Blastococcus sp. CT_GayMR19]|uniref:sensor histidine kinase n=1 Tax=Blastococcus sp. CT_GayMR19 TaxID=2559608 RepID=UPI00107349B1|nr:sensor histidine kinase [Blastococcus sp. CT_GayMR19]TFV70553.1 sensor histidine kinase [Blastococcus sp. CT_GayMR19]
MIPSLPRPAVPPRADVVLAAVFLALSLLQVVLAPIASPVVSVLVAAGSTLPLAWRRVHPAVAALTMTAVWTIPTPQGFLLLGYLIAGLLFYSVGAHEARLWRVVVVTGVGVVVGVVGTLLGPEIWQAAIGAALAVAGPAAAGRLVAHQRSQTALLQELTGRLVQERATAERAAVAEERSRIARELHDVIGHEVTVIALQADAAAAALAKAPERAAVPIEAIRSSAAEALAEMRRVVGMLRAAEEEEDLRPQPGLPDVPALVEQSRAAGLQVDLTLRPPSQPTHASVELAAYRLVQEALTNARRHAPGASVDVRVVGDDAEVLVEVVNREGAIPSPRSESSGFGLVGMRERVRMLGGRLDAGPTDEGGYALTARLPRELPGAP